MFFVWDSTMTDERQQNPSNIIIENDTNFFSPIVSQETTKMNTNKNGKKYRFEDIEIPSVQIATKSNIPPKINNGIWTTEATEERRLRKRYCVKLVILAVLMFFVIGLVIFSSFMLNIVTSRSGSAASNVSSHIGGGQKTHKFRTTTPRTDNQQPIPTKPRPSTKPSRKPTGNIHENNDYITIRYPSQTNDQDKGIITQNDQDNIDQIPNTTIKPAKEEASTNNFITVTEIITGTEIITNPSTTSPIETSNALHVIDGDTIDQIDSLTSTTIYAAGESRITTSDIHLATQTPQTDITTDVVLEIETTLIDVPVTTTDVSEFNEGQVQTSLAPSVGTNERRRTTASSQLTTQTAEIPTIYQHITSSSFPMTTSSPIYHPGCEQVTIDACRSFLPRKSAVSTNLEAHYTYISQSVDLTTCHVNALEVVCSLYAAPCDRELSLNLPCRSTCNHVVRSCFIHDDELYQGWLDNCTRLTESSSKDICFPASSHTSLESSNSCTEDYNCLNGGSCFDFKGQPFCRCPINFAGNRCNISFVPGGEYLPAEPIDESCLPIPNHECAGVLSYNQTLEVLVGAIVEKPPWEIIEPMASCSNDAKLMFCAELYPESECSPLERPPYVICKQLCELVQKQCLYFYAALKFPLICDGGIYQEESSAFYCV